MPELPVEGEQVDAELVLWRAFGLSDVYEDRPLPRWSVEETRGPSDTDRLQVSVGDLPDDLIIAARQWQAQTHNLLEAHVGRPGTVEEQQARYEQQLEAAEPKEFEDPYPSWFTCRLGRPLKITAIPGAVTGWVAAETAEEAVTALRTFEEAGNRYLDGVVARTLGPIQPMNLGHLRYPGRRAFLTAPGRAAFRIPRFRMTIKDSGILIGRGGGWKTAPIDAIASTVRSLPSGGAFGARTSGAAEWFVAALAEEDDDMRRFVFAFAGLELLATQAEKHARAELMRRIKEADPTLPVQQLLWPGTDSDRVARNLVFRFAAMASVYSPTTAIDDVNACRALAKNRNDLFHGVEGGDVRDPSIRCQELLRRYLTLVAAAEAHKERASSRLGGQGSRRAGRGGQ
jgi:hypothetical protein